VYVPENKQLVPRYRVERYPIGFSTAIFFSPALLSAPNNLSITQGADIGIGAGLRWGPVSYFITGEFFRLSQPRQYFLDKYLNANATYNVGGQPQTAIVPNDPVIFHDQWFMSIGFKVCYTFDVFKRFQKETPTGT
jgi:hypothetical protein